MTRRFARRAPAARTAPMRAPVTRVARMALVARMARIASTARMAGVAPIALTVPIAAVLLGSLAGCLGTETGNPPLDGTMSVNAHSSDSATVALRAPEGGAVVEELWVSLGDLEIRPCEGAPFVVPDVGTGDHAGEAALSRPFLGESRPLCEVRVGLVRWEGAAGDAPEAIRGRTLLVRGLDADSRPFELALATIDSVRVAVDEPTTLDEERRGLLIGLDVARWLGTLDLASGEVDVDGVVRIDETHNTTLRDAFVARFAEGFELYRDDDADGVADPGEPLIGRGQP